MAPSQARDVSINATAHLCEVLQVTTSLIMEWPEDQPGYARTMTLLHQGRRLEADDPQDDATLSRIFDPFFASKPEGRGLGLSAVRGFVQGCGGGLRIKTRLGEGTELSLYLRPLAGDASPTP
jgi:phosphoglycerate-specific signal transduction histidine kinase